MTQLTRLLALVFLALAAATPLWAQDGEKQEERATLLKPVPERLERATVTDENGVIQWAEFTAEPCVNCKGQKKTKCLHCDRFEAGQCEKCPECENTKSATCRICAGEGTMPDILVRAPCPSCGGAGFTRCWICQGMGQNLVAGSGAKPQRCDLCKGVGGIRCLTCEGRRYVEPPKFKLSVAEAKSVDLKKSLEVLAKLAEEFPLFASSQDSRKDMKAYAKLVAPGQKLFPALKGAQTHFEAAKKSEAGGSVWKHYPDAVQRSTDEAKDQLEYWAKHQKRLLELCLKRAEANEALAGSGKK